MEKVKSLLFAFNSQIYVVYLESSSFELLKRFV